MAVREIRQRTIFHGPAEVNQLKVGTSPLMTGVQDGSTASTLLATATYVTEQIAIQVAAGTEYRGVLNNLSEVTALTLSDVTVGDIYKVGADIVVTTNPADTPIHEGGSVIPGGFTLQEGADLVWSGTEFDYVSTSLNQGTASGQSPLNGGVIGNNMALRTNGSGQLITVANLGLSQGGTGAGNAAGARTSLGIGTAGQLTSGAASGNLVPVGATAIGANGVIISDASSNLASVSDLPIAMGGTGASTATAALSNLGVTLGTSTGNVPTNGAILGNNAFVTTNGAGGLSTIANITTATLNDVTSTTPTNGQVLIYNDTLNAYVPGAAAGALGSIGGVEFRTVSLSNANVVTSGTTTDGTRVNTITLGVTDVSALIAGSIINNSSGLVEQHLEGGMLVGATGTAQTLSFTQLYDDIDITGRSLRLLYV